MTTATSAATVNFSTHGIPEMILSDNAQYYASEQTTEFMKLNGITHVRSAPYHPPSNGLADRSVQTFKELINKEHR